MKLSPHMFCAWMMAWNYSSPESKPMAGYNVNIGFSDAGNFIHKFGRALLKSPNKLSPIHQRTKKELSLNLEKCKDGKG